ncbi:MAG: glycosyltransferase family 1 protein [Candidatus Kerfeldbacteria bacterium]
MMPNARIGVDMAAAVGQKTGLGFYVDHVVSEMKKQSRDYTFEEINFIKKDLNTPKRILWDQVGLPLAARMKRVDALFVPAFSAPRFRKPVVMTAHDIFGVLYADHFSGPARRYWSNILPNSMKRAARLACISEHTRDDIVTHLGIDKAKTEVIYPAASEDFHIVRDIQWIEQQLRDAEVEAPFVLSVGTLEPRKNFGRLLEAFVYADRSDAKLVLVGKKGWNYDSVYEKIRKYHLQNTVICLDYVSSEQLLALYNACLFFVMPSIYEGFGLPALEAMKCGAPVAVSQNSSLPEVVGEAGVLFDPYEVDSIRERMNLLFNNTEIRSEMQRKSVEQAKKFSWHETARKTLLLFDSVLGS